MIKENENQTFSEVNQLKTGCNLSYHWYFRNVMETENMKVWAVSLETSREYAPLAYLSLKKEKLQTRITLYATLKRLMDIIGALTGLLLTLPVSIILAVLIKISSKGAVIYFQERVGKQGRPFYIYKFRSMVENAEPNGPRLALYDDRRITLVGKFMRGFKLDEIPNFVNVLMGDMAFVGYRPERPYYIEQMQRYTTQYRQLLQIKPGITSFGQVKFGYAATVEEMLQRLKFDLVYLERMSFQTDLFIVLKTFVVIFKGNKPKTKTGNRVIA